MDSAGSMVMTQGPITVVDNKGGRLDTRSRAKMEGAKEENVSGVSTLVHGPVGWKGGRWHGSVSDS